jgi:glycosyltransferase involved in cell wall biosynthesis
MKVLIITSEWPHYENDIIGIHVVNQVNQLLNAGVEVSVFNFLGYKNPFNYVKAIIRLRRFNLRKYDVVHAHHGQSGIVALSQNQCPVVVTFHGSDLQGIRDQRGRLTPLGYILRLSSQWVARRANEIILVADHLARHIHSRPYHLIPAGIDLNSFRPMSKEESRAILELPMNARLILFVGNPERTEKRFWLAQKVVDLLTETIPAQLVIANGVLPERMPLYMNACDLLLVTSSTEGSPNAVKEALACNLPIVSTDVGDIRQRIQSVTGCLVCENDQPETIRITVNQALSKNKCIQGREAVLDFDESILIQKVIMVYQKALSK